MLKKLFYLIRNSTDPFYTVIYESQYFFIDYWSFVHFINGCLIMLALRNLRVRRPFLVLSSLLVLWEIVEIWFIYAAVDIFKPEIIPDQVTDLVIGMLGGLMSGLWPSMISITKVYVSRLVNRRPAGRFSKLYVWGSLKKKLLGSSEPLGK